METNLIITEFVTNYIIPNGKSFFIEDGKMKEGKPIKMAEEILICLRAFIMHHPFYCEYNEEVALEILQKLGVIFKDREGYWYTSSVINYAKLNQYLKEETDRINKQKKSSEDNSKLIMQISTVIDEKMSEFKDRTVAATTESINNVLYDTTEWMKNRHFEQNNRIAASMIDVYDALRMPEDQKSDNGYSLPEKIREIIHEEVSSLLDVQQKGNP